MTAITEEARSYHRGHNKKYYGATQYALRSGLPFTQQEDRAIQAKVGRDNLLAAQLKRSVQSIQLRRMRLKRGAR